MPVPAPNLYPPFNILRFSHVVLNVTDLARSRAFYADLLGLQVTEQVDCHVHMNATGARDTHAIVLQAAEAATVARLAFRTFGDADLPRAKAYLVGKGFLARWVDRPFQGRTLAFEDNQGAPIELHHKIRPGPTVHEEPTDHRGDRPLGINRIAVTATSVDESVAFYRNLGFRVTEYVEDMTSRRLWGALMSRGSVDGSIAILNGHGPKMHHVALRMATPQAIIDRLDLITSNGRGDCIEWGPGRHTPTGAMFTYLRDPDGHRIGLTCDQRPCVDADAPPVKWEVTDPRFLSRWGGPPPDSWITEGSPFEGVDVGQPHMTI